MGCDEVTSASIAVALEVSSVACDYKTASFGAMVFVVDCHLPFTTYCNVFKEALLEDEPFLRLGRTDRPRSRKDT